MCVFIGARVRQMAAGADGRRLRDVGCETPCWKAEGLISGNIFFGSHAGDTRN